MSAAHCQRSRNPLLVKDDVGKAKPSCYNLPGDDFAYGRPDLPDYEGAREVTMQWVAHKAEQRQDSDVQDFRKLNKASLKAKALDARAQSEFRKNANVPLEHMPPCAPPKIYPSEVVPSFTYGKKTRPSTPISQVISNQFGAEYESALEDMYAHYEDEKNRATKACEGHARKAKLDDPSNKHANFKLSKFK